MIRGRTIICIASAWDYDPTSKHHIMKILSRENRVLWVNYHGSRKPGASVQDVRAIGRVLRRAVRGMEPISDSMAQLTPLVVPGATSPMGKYFSEKMLVSQIRRACRLLDRHAKTNGDAPVQVWSFAPDVPFLQGAFDEECFVYYCVDEFREFAGFDRERIAQAEDRMLQDADVVITSALPLLESRRSLRPDAHLVRHGVDADHFRSAYLQRPSRPIELPDTGQPVLGFFGLIEHWIDLPLIAEVARRRPGYQFVLLGDCRISTSSLSGLSNVHLLGRRPYAELPAYCAAFSAGLMPFVQTTMTRNVNPIKMREYLAAGLPVVSTPIPEAAAYPRGVRVAENAQTFAAACDEAIAMGTRCDRAQISALVARDTWEARVEQLSDIVAGSLGGAVSAPRTSVESAIRTISNDTLDLEHTKPHPVEPTV